MSQFGKYIGLAFIAGCGIYMISQLNTTSNVIGKMNREHKQQRIDAAKEARTAEKMAEAIKEDHYAMEDHDVPDPTEAPDWDSDDAGY